MRAEIFWARVFTHSTDAQRGPSCVLGRDDSGRSIKSRSTEKEPTGSTQPSESPTSKKIQGKDIAGLKYFDKLAPLLERLHEDGCLRNQANHRKLHYDQYCMLLLLYYSTFSTRS